MFNTVEELLNTSFDFTSLEPASKPVKVKTRDGEVREYLLVEASEAAAVRWKNGCIRGAKMDDGKVTSVDLIADVEPRLVADCLVVVKNGVPQKDPLGNYVTESLTEVLKLPPRVVEPMFNWIIEVSRLQPKPTADSLRKQIKSLQDKLQKMLVNTGGSEDPSDPKPSPSGGTATSV